jgi:hypothetical protein
MLINTPQAMNNYVGAVMRRARHHGGNVTDAVKTLKLFVAEYGHDLQISDRQGGKIGNVSWFKSKATNKPYYFRYSHDGKGSIEMLHTNCNGHLVARFDNRTTAREFVAVFETL